MIPAIVHQLKAVPHQPGCYLFKDSRGRIIYVGKAKDLKKRVSSYFRQDIADQKTQRLVERIADFEYIVTDTELEAFLLEARLIQQHQPDYNIDLKAGIRYAYIRLTKELFPRLETARLISPRDVVFGPFAIGENRKQLIWLANSLFKLRTGKRRPVRMGDRYQIQCSTVPWRRLVTPTEYSRDVRLARLLLAGKMPELITTLEREMKAFSQRQQYELAKLRRDQIVALEGLAEKQKVQLKKRYDQDVINYVKTPNTFLVQIFNINRGVVSGRKKFKLSRLKAGNDSSVMLADFLRQYYYTNEIPQEVLVPESVRQPVLLARYLTKLSNRQTRIVVPRQGDKYKLLALVRKNILADLSTKDQVLAELQQALDLPELPSMIECFDISNLGADYMVGSMVRFTDGVADKANYRRFKIKWQRRQSDFDAMREIVFRRYYRLKIEAAPLPNLVLIDGGRPQLTAALRALRQLRLAVPIVALAKQQEELFLPSRPAPIRLPRRSAALKLVQRIRDEAHRFAITYHRLLRQKPFEK